MVKKTLVAMRRLSTKCTPAARRRSRRPKGLRGSGATPTAGPAGGFEDVSLIGRFSNKNGPPRRPVLCCGSRELARDRTAHRREVLRQDGRAGEAVPGRDRARAYGLHRRVGEV